MKKQIKTKTLAGLYKSYFSHALLDETFGRTLDENYVPDLEKRPIVDGYRFVQLHRLGSERLVHQLYDQCEMIFEHVESGRRYKCLFLEEDTGEVGYRTSEDDPVEFGPPYEPDIHFKSWCTAL